jgi:molybdenum cofactor biosynthesis enzyme MoaA
MTFTKECNILLIYCTNQMHYIKYIETLMTLLRHVLLNMNYPKKLGCVKIKTT